MTNVSLTRDGAVLVLRLDRPEKKNALTRAMYDSLVEGLREAETDDTVRVVVLTGHPGVFTAGNDLMDFVADPPSGPESPVFRFLYAASRFPKPIVAAVDGPAIGLGTTVLLHCDLIVASPAAKFRMPFVPLGIVPEFGSSLLLPMRVGWQRASEWLLLGDTFGADEALRAGLVNRVVPSDEVEPTAMAFAQALADRPPIAVRLTKELLRAPIRAELDATLQREGDLFVERIRSDEAVAAMTAFLTRGRK